MDTHFLLTRNGEPVARVALAADATQVQLSLEEPLEESQILRI